MKMLRRDLVGPTISADVSRLACDDSFAGPDLFQPEAATSLLARFEKLVHHDRGVPSTSRYEHLRALRLLTQHVRVGCFIKLMRLLETSGNATIARTV